MLSFSRKILAHSSPIFPAVTKHTSSPARTTGLTGSILRPRSEGSLSEPSLSLSPYTLYISCVISENASSNCDCMLSLKFLNFTLSLSKFSSLLYMFCTLVPIAFPSTCTTARKLSFTGLYAYSSSTKLSLSKSLGNTQPSGAATIAVYSFLVFPSSTLSASVFSCVPPKLSLLMLSHLTDFFFSSSCVSLKKASDAVFFSFFFSLSWSSYSMPFANISSPG